MSSEEFLSINLADLFKRDVWNFMLKTTVDVDTVITSPATVSESLNRVEFVPLGGFSVINLERHNLSDLVSSATNNHHKWSQEESRVLVSRHRTLGLTLVRSLDPVPSAVSVSSEAPRVLQGILVVSSSSKNNHHTGSASHGTKGGRVINSDIWHVSWGLEFQPREWSFVDIEAPDIVDWLSSCVSTEHE